MIFVTVINDTAVIDPSLCEMEEVVAYLKALFWRWPKGPKGNH
jgi:hypothetical protein